MIGELYVLPAILGYNADGGITSKDTRLLVLAIESTRRNSKRAPIARCLDLDSGLILCMHTDVLATDGVRLS